MIILLIASKGSSTMTLILAGEPSWVGFPKVVHWDPFDLRKQCALTGEARSLGPVRR